MKYTLIGLVAGMLYYYYIFQITSTPSFIQFMAGGGLLVWFVMLDLRIEPTGALG